MIRPGPDKKRREFTMLRGGVAVTWPFAARAQQAALPVIGLLGSDTAAAQSEWTAAFVQRLRELGWDEGRNIVIEYRWGEGRTERFAEIAAEFVQRKVTLILTHTRPTLAAKRPTSTIPIVFATAGDPRSSASRYPTSSSPSPTRLLNNQAVVAVHQVN